MSTRTMAVARATGVISATIALVAGVTFAQVTSSASLVGNTLSSASSALTISSTGGFGATATGFNFSDVVPGGGLSDSHAFTLKDDSTSNTTITVSMTDPSGGYPANIDINKVYFSFTGPGGTAKYSIAQLRSGQNPLIDNFGDVKDANNSVGYTVAASIDADGVSGSSVDLSSFDFVFTSTPLVP